MPSPVTKSGSDLLTILRNVTGRIDESDPLFTNSIMMGYLTDFLALDSTQDIRIFHNKTWWEFDITPILDEDGNIIGYNDEYDVNLDNITLINGNVGASTIGPLSYSDGFYNFWFQDPGQFYRIWPETQTYQTSRPTYVLYYNNKLLFRNPPDQIYTIKIEAYEVQPQLTTATNLNSAYLYRYAAYGAALNLFADYGEMDRYQEIYPVFMRYRALVYGRTNLQYQNQRPSPEF